MRRCLTATAVLLTLVSGARAADVLDRADARFESGATEETPSFRKHVIPLLGKLGCNGRACHGSFQGQGGFRLSLFGYDFEMDHEGLAGGDEPRVDPEFAENSLALLKPTLEMPHRGGKRFDEGGWEYNLLVRWIESGAKNVDEAHPEFERIEVTPREIVFDKADETAQLKVVAVWSDGSREDVTPLCRFQSNGSTQATIDANGLVTAVEPGDTHVVVFYDNGVVPIPVIQPVSKSVGPAYPDVPTPTKVDELVVEKLRKLGIVQSETCTDAEFLRRVSLDMIGTLPTPREIESFLADGSPDKRARKIDELLERPAYAACGRPRSATSPGTTRTS